MRYWIGIASRDHVKAGVAGGFCQLCHGKSAPMKRLKPGDRIVYYSPRTEMKGGETVQAFTAIGEISASEPYPFEMTPGFVPTRRDVTFYDATDAPIHPLIERLSITRGRKSWGYVFRFGVVEITAEDYGVIAEAMGIDATARA